MLVALDGRMPRNRSFIRNVGPFHVGARTNNQEWFHLPSQELWELSTDLLSFTARAFHLEVQSYVLMSNHYHLLVSAPERNLPEAMNYLQREFSRSVGRETHRINHLFGGPFFASYIDDWRYLHAAYKYIYRNPVEAKLAYGVDLYPFNTLNILLGEQRNPLTVIDPLDLHENPDGVLRWLNHDFEKEQRECIRKGLRHPKFEWKTGPSKRNCWTDDLVFRTNAPGYEKVGRTFG